MTTDRAKIKPTHLCRDAFVYLRQSTPTQLDGGVAPSSAHIKPPGHIV